MSYTTGDKEIVDALSKSDPVYVLEGVKPMRRKCALCKSIGAPNAENVGHLAACPWVRALEARDPYGPGGKWDRTRAKP